MRLKKKHIPKENHLQKILNKNTFKVVPIVDPDRIDSLTPTVAYQADVENNTNDETKLCLGVLDTPLLYKCSPQLLHKSWEFNLSQFQKTYGKTFESDVGHVFKEFETFIYYEN